jgi:hypothetical protein
MEELLQQHAPALIDDAATYLTSSIAATAAQLLYRDRMLRRASAICQLQWLPAAAFSALRAHDTYHDNWVVRWCCCHALLTCLA